MTGFELRTSGIGSDRSTTPLPTISNKFTCCHAHSEGNSTIFRHFISASANILKPLVGMNLYTNLYQCMEWTVLSQGYLTATTFLKRHLTHGHFAKSRVAEERGLFCSRLFHKKSIRQLFGFKSLIFFLSLSLSVWPDDLILFKYLAICNQKISPKISQVCQSRLSILPNKK